MQPKCTSTEWVQAQHYDGRRKCGLKKNGSNLLAIAMRGPREDQTCLSVDGLTISSVKPTISRYVRGISEDDQLCRVLDGDELDNHDHVESSGRTPVT